MTSSRYSATAWNTKLARRGYSAYREILLSMIRGSNGRACSYRERLVHRASSPRCNSLKGRNIHIHYRCVPLFSPTCVPDALLSRACIAPLKKFIGRTRRDRSRIRQSAMISRGASKYGATADTWVSQSHRSIRAALTSCSVFGEPEKLTFSHAPHAWTTALQFVRHLSKVAIICFIKWISNWNKIVFNIYFKIKNMSLR